MKKMKTIEEMRSAYNRNELQELTMQAAHDLNGKKIATIYFGYRGQDGVDEFVVGDLKKDEDVNDTHEYVYLYTQDGRNTFIFHDKYTIGDVMECSDNDRTVYYMLLGDDENGAIVSKLAEFLHGETLEECPIHVVSRDGIDGEEAELIRFTFGEGKESCVAVMYSDGSIFTPSDWVSPIWEDEDWEIEDCQWMDSCFNECVNMNGMPRKL